MAAIRSCWTKVRAHGSERVAMPVKPVATSAELDEGQCPCCNKALFGDDAELVAVPLGPGADAEARQAQRRGEWFDSMGVICHKACVGETRPAAMTPAMKVAAASDLVREAAGQVSARAKAHGVGEDYDPTEPLLTIVMATEQASKDLSGWEEQLV